MPVQAREVAHSGRASHRVTIAHLGLRDDGDGLREVAVLPVVGVIVAKFACDPFCAFVIPTHGCQCEQDGADTRRQGVTISQVSSAIFGTRQSPRSTTVSNTSMLRS